MYSDNPQFKSIFSGNDSEKPSDMADNTVLSPDGVNPVAKNDEKPSESGIFDDVPGILIPGAVPPAYFPGFPDRPV